MVIRTGVLNNPLVDEAASQAVHRLLDQQQVGYVVVLTGSAAGPRNLIEETLRRWCDEEELDLVITVGGTLPAPGPSQLENIPEATLAVAERLVPGLPEAMRAHAGQTSRIALLDRSVCAIRGRTLILNLPEGAGLSALFLEGVVDQLPGIVAHLQSSANAPRPIDQAWPELDQSGHDQPAASRHPTAFSGLDSEEFAEFLAARRTGGGKR
jgi:molybdopterin adenylyltransferase